MELVRELQPNTLLNDRLDLLDMHWGWDFRTPEQVMPQKWPVVDGERGYIGRPITRSLVRGAIIEMRHPGKAWSSACSCWPEAVSKGGNLTFNVGPTARGDFDRRALDRLAGIGGLDEISQQDRSMVVRKLQRKSSAPDNLARSRNKLRLNRLFPHRIAAIQGATSCRHGRPRQIRTTPKRWLRIASIGTEHPEQQTAGRSAGKGLVALAACLTSRMWPYP